MTREEAIEILWQYDVDFEPHPAEKVMHAIDMAIEALSADVVRCKDCRHWKTDSHCDGYRSGEDFCSWGEEQNK